MIRPGYKQFTGDNSIVAVDGEGKRGKLGRARDDDVLPVIEDTLDLQVVGLDIVIGKHKEGGASV